MSQLTANTAAVEVYSPRPRNGQVALHEQLLTSISSTESASTNSTEALPSPSQHKIRHRTHVQFAKPKPLLKNPGAKEPIKVDEVDDGTPPVLEKAPSRSARSRSRSLLRNAAGPRSASRPARRRALSRGRPISRDTTCDQPDDPVMTPDQIARELRPESFTRFKRITLSSNMQKTSNDKFDTGITAELRELREADFENEARAMREKLERNHSPASLSPAEETHPDALNTVDFQDVKLPETEAFDPNNFTGEEDEQD